MLIFSVAQRENPSYVGRQSWGFSRGWGHFGVIAMEKVPSLITSHVEATGCHCLGDRLLGQGAGATSPVGPTLCSGCGLCQLASVTTRPEKGWPHLPHLGQHGVPALVPAVRRCPPGLALGDRSRHSARPWAPGDVSGVSASAAAPPVLCLAQKARRGQRKQAPGLGCHI